MSVLIKNKGCIFILIVYNVFCWLINEGEKLIRLMSNLDENCSDKDIWNELSERLDSDEMEVMNDLVYECKKVGDDDISGFDWDIEEVCIVDYCNGFKKFVSDMKDC